MTESLLMASGWVSHQRHHPTRHGFNYPVSYVCVDSKLIDETPQCHQPIAINRFGVIGLYRADLIQPSSMSIREAVEHTLSQQGHSLPSDVNIRVLTLPRFFGYTFNPVSFYTITCEDGSLYAMLSDITNTPWGERHTYVHMASEARTLESNTLCFSHDKTFHVSPFMPMALEYQWEFSQSERKQTIRIKLLEHLDDSDLDNTNTESSSRLKFNASFNLTKSAFSQQARWKTIRSFAFLPIKIVTQIYWHALILWIKRVPFFKHPKHTTTPT